MPEAPPPRSLARGALAVTVATAASRVTGLVRVVVVAGALGTTFLANTYQTANTAPNLVFELVAAGVLTSVFVPMFVEHLMARRNDEGWEAADVLTTVVLVGLMILAAGVVAAAPAIMSGLTIGVTDPVLRAREIDVGSDLLRLFAPQIVFYGAGIVMTSALHAHRRFGLAAAAPIFSNVVVIATYLTYAAMRAARPPDVADVTAAEVVVLGTGTTLGVVAMTLVLVPPLRRLGWAFRIRFDPRHPVVRKALRIGIWALGYAGGYQAGLIVVLLLANQIEGGVAAYQWAYTFFYVPHALFAVPIFSVLFTAMTERVVSGDEAGIAGRLRDGIAMLAFVLLPVAAALVVTASPLAHTTLRFGVMTGAGADLVARVLMSLTVGLPGYSLFLVMTRAFYARSETKVPALVNAGAAAVAAGVGAWLFGAMPERWAVAGLGAGHSAGFSAGALVLVRLYSRRWGSIASRGLGRSVGRTVALTAAATAAMVATRALVGGESRLAIAIELVVALAAGGTVYLGAAALLRVPELRRIAGAIPVPPRKAR